MFLLQFFVFAGAKTNFATATYSGNSNRPFDKVTIMDMDRPSPDFHYEITFIKKNGVGEQLPLMAVLAAPS
jgi:hypothetical protein